MTIKIRSRNLPQGFTLVELLVVILIVSVLVAISVTMVIRFKNTGDRVVATNNLKQLQVANISYATENGGRFVPPSEEEKDPDGSVIANRKWFENPVFISQIKGTSATYPNSTTIDTSLDKSHLDPVVSRKQIPGSDKLDSSFGYTSPETSEPYRQSQLENQARSAAFITADAGFADFGSSPNIAYRHSKKAIVVYYDGHASSITQKEISAKSITDIFWKTSSGD